MIFINYIIIGVLIILILFLIIWYILRKRKAIKKVKCNTDLEKLYLINTILNPFGFEFDLNKDIVISKKDCWQREFGYMDLYDKKAPIFNIVMDCLPICFDYNNKRYRIEFWKGQYGITTGAEVGIYINDELSFSKCWYRAANDDECIKINYSLIKKCHLFSRCGCSWWLTGFDVGAFSKPKNLKMNICLKFPNCEMKEAFINSLIDAGYARDNIQICGSVIRFEYCYPSNYKPNRTHRLIKCISQFFNFINCHIYLFLTSCFNRTIDRLAYLYYMYPCLCRLIINLCIPQRKKKCYPKK